MSTVKLDEQKAAEIAAFYHAELQKTMARYNHIKSTLESLGESPAVLDVSGMPVSAPKTRRRRKGKPGPTSVWDKKILKRIKAINKPVTYEELTDDIMVFDGHPKEKRANIKASIINVTYRLRKRDKKIDTFSMGTREKFIALKSWFDENGEILEAYSSRLKIKKKMKYDGPKRPVGRPKGSKNKKGAKKPGPKRPVGRPKGSKNRKGALKPGPKPKAITAVTEKKTTPPAVKRTVAKKAPAKKAPAKKTPAKKTEAKKTEAKKSTTAKKTVAKKQAAAKKPSAKKSTAKKPAAKKGSTAKKSTAKKASPKKAGPKKPTAVKKAAAKSRPAAKKSKGPLVIKNK